MSPRFDRAITRRGFIQFLAASPLFARAAAPGLAQSISTPARLPDPMVWAPREIDNLISDPRDALDVFDFEPVARKHVPPPHFGYMVTGIASEMARTFSPSPKMSRSSTITSPRLIPMRNSSAPLTACPHCARPSLSALRPRSALRRPRSGTRPTSRRQYS